MKKIVMTSESKKSLIVSQSNRLVESRYSLSVGEQRIILAMISLIQPDDEDLKPYALKINDLAKLLNVDTKNAYREADKITSRLMGRVLHIPQQNGDLLKIHWVAVATHKKGSVELEFHPKMKPYLLHLKEQFTRYNLNTITQFQSSYSIRIYSLLKQYEAIGSREFEVSELREILGIQESKYKQYKDLNKWVLNQAKKEFEKQVSKNGAFQSDISFDLETIRTGRKITHLKFIIKKQPYQESLRFELPEETEPKEIPEIIKRLEHYGIAEPLAYHFCEKNGEQSINDTLVLYEKRLEQKKVDDKKGGYLIKLLETKAGETSPFEKEQEQKDQEKKQVLQAFKQKEKALEEEKSLYKAERQKQADDYFKQRKAPEKTAIVSAFEKSTLFKEKITSGTTTQQAYKKDGINSVLIRVFFRSFVVESYLPEELHSFENWQMSHM